MKIHMRIYALMLCLVLLFSFFAGCGVSGPETSETTTAVPEGDSVEAQGQEIQEDQQAQAQDSADVQEIIDEQEPGSMMEPEPEETISRVEYTLPLYDEDQSFSFWSMYNTFDGSRMEFPFWQQLQEATGVAVDFKEVNIDVCNEQYNLMIASGDLTDVIWEKSISMDGSAAYPGGYAKALEDGVYLDLTEMIHDACPNYYSILIDNPSALRDISLDDGRLFSFSQIYSSPAGDVQGMYVQKNILSELGYETPPETVEGWLICWKAMVEAGSATYYLSDLDGSGISNAFGASSGFLVERNTDQVFFGATAEEFRDYLAYVIELYQNGILRDNFYATFPSHQDLDAGLYATFLTRKGAAENVAFPICAVPPMHLEGTQEPKLVNYNNCYAQVGNDLRCCLTSACSGETLDVVLKWFDFLYSDYGIEISNYGFEEGVSYEIVNGKMQLLPEMLQRDEGNRINQMLYTMQTGPSYIYSDIEEPLWSEARAEAEATFSNFDPDEAIYSTMPPVSLSVEESNEISSFFSDINDYVTTESLSWVTGTKELNDETWNEFVTTVSDMGIDACTELYQKAYDRYLAR